MNLEQKEKMLQNTAAIVLAGGKSSRMGQDKRKCLYHGSLFLELAISKTEAFGERFLSANDQEFSFPGVRQVPDIETGLGPFGGLMSVLPLVILPWILLVPCDMPKLRYDSLIRLYEQREGREAVMFRDREHRYPLPLLCKTETARRLTALGMETGNYALGKLIRFSSVSCAEASISEEMICCGDMDNINTPQDYAALKK